MALDALDTSICAVLGSEQFDEHSLMSKDDSPKVSDFNCICVALNILSHPTTLLSPPKVKPVEIEPD